MTGNETKVQEGKEKIHGSSITERASDGDTTDPDHPGITYTKRGAMKQINLQRPPPPSISVTENHQQPPFKDEHPGISHTDHGAVKQTCFKPPQTTNDDIYEGSKWTADTEGTYDFGNNFDTHPHENYAGPNLTKTLASPRVGDDDDLAIVQEKQGQEERYDLLHGGFPTAAPSPGRGKGAEIIDKFDK
jgi:hypothetical protein